MVTIKPFRFKSANRRKLGAHQKVCPKCQRIVHADLPRCPSCAHAPWIWQPNARFLLITVVIALFVLVLCPLMTNQRTYREPAISASEP